MAPTADEVKQIYLSWFDGGAFNVKNFENVLATDYRLHVSGRDFVCGGSELDLKDFIAQFVNPVVNAFDKTKPIKTQVIRVIVSPDSPWVAVETRFTATTKNGKPWFNEGVTIISFNAEGKVTGIKIYIDTQHVHDHVTANA